MTATLDWEPWDRTHDGVLEWTCWDETDKWFMTVVKEKGQLLWRWHAAFAPGDGDALAENEGRAVTKAGAMKKAIAWCERMANQPAPADWYTRHLPECGSAHRGCSMHCLKDIYERTGVWVG